MTPSFQEQTQTLAVPASAAPCPIAPGDVVAGRYTIELLLGEGTFGWVFSAIDSNAPQPRRVAVKVLRPERARIPEGLQRFERELALLRIAHTCRARHVVRVLEPQLGWHRGLPFIVLELIDGPSLRDRINDGRPFTEVEAARIGRDITRGLAALHAAGIVHRDLKPANIQLRGGEEPVIIDLGVATAPGVVSDLTVTGKAPMTPRYAAPEQLAGRATEAPCDIYALGVILEEMAAGKRLDAIGRRCLEREPSRRPIASDLAAEIGSLLIAGPGRLQSFWRWALRLVVLGAAVSLVAPDQAISLVETSPWTPAASMLQRRDEHTSTRLANGDVLVVGGYDMKSRAFVTTAERYDPSLDSWSLAGAIEPRKVHTATLLPNGEVLAAGGIGPRGWLADAARYAPATNTWTKAARMSAVRGRFTATYLPSVGKVLVAGGGDAQGAPQSGAELYDPELDRWTAAAPMRTARISHEALWIPSLTRVLVLGGSEERGFSEASLELYDPSAQRWVSGAPMAIGRDRFTATLLADGRVLVAGGTDRGTTLKSAEIYDPSADRWMDAASMRAPRCQHTATLLADGRVLIAGGASSADAEIYDPTLDRWSSGGWPDRSLDSVRGKRTLTRLMDGRVLMAGERGGGAWACDLFEPGAQAPKPSSGWTRASPMLVERSRHTMTLLPDGRVLTVGVPHGVRSNLAEIYDPRANTWEVPLPMTATPPGRFAPTATLVLGETEVLITGGAHTDGNHDSTERFDPARSLFLPAQAMSSFRTGHTATLLEDGEVFVTGGYGAGLHATSERYDPVKDSWTPSAPMHAARIHHAAVMLRDGRVLAAGGVGSGKGLIGSSELYSPATDTWTPETPLTSPRARATAILLYDGRVLLAGGYGEADSKVGAEIYDPSRDRWQPTAPMRTPRLAYAAVLLPNGKVLVAGGRQDELTYLDSVEIYDPTRNSWSDAPSMGSARCEAAAILLSDGRVLVTGGFGEGRRMLSSAEIYSLK